MRYPKLNPRASTRQIISAFKGYNHNLQIEDGEFYDTKNMTTAYYPMMANRDKRSLIKTITSGQGMIEKDALAYIDNGKLYYNNAEVSGLTFTTGDKQIVSMGAYIIVFPDKKYYNTQDPDDKGSIETTFSYTGRVTYTMCDSTGTAYSNVTSSSTAPSSPSNNDYWNDNVNHELKQWSAQQSMWVTIETVYTKVSFSVLGQLSQNFNEYDGVEISGLTYNTDLDGNKIIYAVGGGSGTEADYVVLVGICNDTPHQESSETVTIKRTVPDLDYVCECQNRLWGCFYGNDGTQNLNEIYCCSLGDFKNWNQFLGLSTDSYVASVGSDGVWTGAINYLGYPTFCKENVFHIVNVSSTGAHSITELPAPGVQKGSSKSLVVVDSTMYYKGRVGVYAYQGSFPTMISEDLGDERYKEAVGGAFGRKYYVSMKDSSSVSHLFCYDIRKGLWMHEDNLNVKCFAKVDDELYAMVGTQLIGINGVVGTQEDPFEWSATTGILQTRYTASSSSYVDPDQKTVIRYDIRCQLAPDAEFKFFIEYDSSSEWEYQGTVKFTGLDSFNIPVRPRRCDHLRIKFEGEGDIRAFSIARYLSRGSDR